MGDVLASIILIVVILAVIGLVGVDWDKSLFVY